MPLTIVDDRNAAKEDIFGWNACYQKAKAASRNVICQPGVTFLSSEEQALHRENPQRLWQAATNLLRFHTLICFPVCQNSL